MAICLVHRPQIPSPQRGTALTVEAPARPGLSRGTALTLAVAGALTVANIYFPQPLLDAIASGLGVSDSAAGLVATAAQIGYAFGISLVVPLADVARLRRLVTVLLALTTAGLLVAAAAPNLATLTVATVALSTTTVVPQILMPTAASMAGPAHSGRAVGMIGIGLTLGSTLSRTLSGAVVGLSGDWRTAYLVAAALTGALALVVPRLLPERTGRGGDVSYRKLIGSMPGLLVAHAELRLSAYLGGTVFAAFSAFWATLAFHLAGPAFGKGVAWAGLFGLFSLPAALLSYSAGRLSDQRGPLYVNTLALGCVGVAFLLMGTVGTTSMAALVIGCNLLVYGGSCWQIANQVRIFRLDERIRARLNTLFMLASFAGGAVGTLTGTLLYEAYGWTGMVLGCGGFLALAAAGLLRARHLD
ncbi:MFS transporter [Streptomyces ficellus]|uniref:MFS transporter n=1 Tax=Streptomyces ficellus TaxID=1977088 RepID=A0A6I6FTI6_9ACTN|nr:MFS transporter [Streptomyces ficellus]